MSNSLVHSSRNGLGRLPLFGVLAITIVLGSEPARSTSALPRGQGGRRAAVVACSENHTGIDTVGADSLAAVFNGRGQGQVVALSETLVTAFTVYRQAREDSLPYFTRLFVTDVDSTGKPMTTSVEYAGPIIAEPLGDGLHPVPFKFVLDPPLVLPHPGLYYFNISEAHCFGFFWLLADSRNPYPQGANWRTGTASCDPRGPGTPMQPFYSEIDLIFDVATCATTTAVRRGTWGELKQRYH